MKKNKTPASVRTGLYIFFKSMFYIDRLHVRTCLYWCIRLLLVNSSNELMFAIDSIRHKKSVFIVLLKKKIPFMTTSFN